MSELFLKLALVPSHFIFKGQFSIDKLCVVEFACEVASVGILQLALAHHKAIFIEITYVEDIFA